MSAFDIDFDRLIKLFLPEKVYLPELTAYLRSALVPLESLYNQFIVRRTDTLFILKYDTSKRNLEIALRTKFNDEGIYVENAKKGEGLYLDFYLDAYLREAGYETAVQPAYLEQYLDFYLDKELPTDDFTIYLPELTFLTSARAVYDFVAYFVLPGFKYSVQRY